MLLRLHSIDSLTLFHTNRSVQTAETSLESGLIVYQIAFKRIVDVKRETIFICYLYPLKRRQQESDFKRIENKALKPEFCMK
jgi:hypothetical protein